MSKSETSFHLNQPLKIGVTTPVRYASESVARAQRAANHFHCAIVPRQKRGLTRLMAEEDLDGVFVADVPLRLVLRDEPELPLFFHPGMAALRISEWRKGRHERLIQTLHVRAGDFVVDATMGLAADSLVLAEAVGDEGRVVAIESSPWLAQLVTYAQKYESHLYPTVERPLQRLEIVCTSHQSWLEEAPDQSVDIIYFDPMFRQPLHNRSSFIEGARGLTNTSALTMGAWREAKRVAKRAVGVKERPDSPEFERLGLTPDKRLAKVAFGIWERGVGEAT